MTMEVESEAQAPVTTIGKDEIVDYLIKNPLICFKSQQIDEDDLTNGEKTRIALEIYDKSKLNFLVRFGKYLLKDHLDFFECFTSDCELAMVLKDHREDLNAKHVKNRRYEALRQMILEDAYFSEIEMMKRSPLLYEQLIGKYLTDEEKSVRDKIEINDGSTLVKVLMEGIERDDARSKKKEEEEIEEKEMVEEEDGGSSPEPEPSYSRWGEFTDEGRPITIKKTVAPKSITLEEQELLKDEFLSLMHQSFLDGKDEDFDYESVDHNTKYDNTEIKECDEEDKYFDSEEPETVERAMSGEESSEDELDIYMSALNQNPAVARLSEDMENL